MAVWATKCAFCHGDKGQGGAVDKAAIDVSDQTDAQVWTLIEQGRGGMPGFGAQLTPPISTRSSRCCEAGNNEHELRRDTART